MTPKDLSIVVRGVAPVLREYVGVALNPLGDRLNTIEHRLVSIRDGEVGPQGEQGHDGERGPEGPQGPPGPAGKDADETRIAELEATIQRMVQQIEMLTSSVAKASELEPMIEAAVTKAIAAMPAPKDGEPGKSVDRAEVAAMVSEQVSTAVAGIVIPEPAGIKGALIDNSGALVLTFSDGRTQAVGHVMGRDGADADLDSIKRHIEHTLASWPRPKDGVDGQDGLGFDDIVIEHDGERTFTIKMVRGERVKNLGTFTVPVTIHRGVWTSTREYAYQDATTFSGSQWLCVDPTKKGKPGAGSPEDTGWILVVKEGRPGKQGPAGPIGLTGKQGPMGPQGRSGY